MRKLALLMMVAVLGACGTLPSVGPSRGNIESNSTAQGGNIPVIAVTHSVARASYQSAGYGFPSSFYQNGTISYEAIRSGDIIQITVWENVDNGTFATLGARVTPLSEMRVSSAGTIFMPYVGQIKASGKTPDQLRREITQQLSTQTPDPQVEVRVLTPSSQGGVMLFTQGGGGLVPLNEGNLTLAAMLASAGGAGAADPRTTRVTLTRGGQSGTILLQSLYDNSKNDVTLRRNDRIILEADRRYYRILGAGSAQGLIPFSRSEVSVLDAISETGGLNGATSDATGIFVFRTISAQVANRLISGNRYSSPVNVVFTINLKDADGLFLGQEFKISDKDTIYITEAPFVTWTKVISSLTSATDSITDITSLLE